MSWCLPLGGVHAIHDPYNLSPDHADCMQASLLHFKAQDPWVARILQGCKSQWWIKNCIRVPLLQEVAQLIRAKKSKKSHEPRFADAILPLQVRGKVLWFHNSQKCVTLALREDKVGKSTDVDQGEVQGEGEGKDHAIEDLRWFLTQLDNDILSMQPAEPDTIPVKAKAPVGRAAGSAPPDLKDMVASCLKLLRSDPACKTAAFHTSKSSFSVVREEGKARKSFRVLGLKRKREAAATSDSKDLQDAFDRSVQRARTWMAGPAHGAAEGSDEDEEDQSEHAPDSQRAEDPAGAGGSD